jgi:Ca2+-binding RTX toxin-like protein
MYCSVMIYGGIFTRAARRVVVGLIVGVTVMVPSVALGANTFCPNGQLGTPNPDNWSGGSGNNEYAGLNANDTIAGNGGVDRLCGDADNDDVDGGTQADLIDGDYGLVIPGRT